MKSKLNNQQITAEQLAAIRTLYNNPTMTERQALAKIQAVRQFKERNK